MIEEKPTWSISYGGIDNSGPYLEHYGVKGMKWGVRNEPERTGGGGRHRFKTAIDNVRERKRLNNPNKMNDQEINDQIKRLELEDRMRKAQGKLTRREATDRTLKFADMIANTATSSITGLVNIGQAWFNMRTEGRRALSALFNGVGKVTQSASEITQAVSKYSQKKIDYKMKLLSGR